MYHSPSYNPVAIIRNTKRFPVRKQLPQVFDSKRGQYWNPEKTSGIVAVSGIRRGFNGRQPRTSAPALVSDCVVTTADGSRYTIKRRTTSRNSTGRPTGVSVEMLNAIADRRAKKSYASDQAAIGNID